MVSFNPSLDAGKTITLEVESNVANNQSARHSGKFLIEYCRHVYDKESKTPYTQLFVGRRDIQNIPQTYSYQEKLI